MNGHPKNLGDAIDICLADVVAPISQNQAINIIRETESVVYRYLAEELGFERKEPTRRITQQERKAIKAFLKTLSLRKLPSIVALVEKAFERHQVSDAVRYTYGGRIRKLLEIAQQQFWYPGNRKTDRFRDECAPRLPRCFGRTSDTQLAPERITTLHYSLTDNDISPSLQAELDDFLAFCSASYYPDRVIDACGEETEGQYLLQAKLLLGWWWRYYQPELTKDQLSLKLLVPLVTSDDLEELSPKERDRRWRQASNHIKAWVDRYFTFMTEELGSFSPRTREQRMIVVAKITHYVYTREVESKAAYGQIPVANTVKGMQEYWRKEAKRWQRLRKYSANQDAKWPDTGPDETALGVLRKGLLQKLMLRCRPRNSSGVLHDPHPQARFLAAFIIWYELVDEPPRRQQEFRTRRLSLSCPIERPASVPADGLYHPLPPPEVRDRQADGSCCDNYMYKVYEHRGRHYSEGIWVRQVTKYKTDKVYGQQEIILRDRLLSDGRKLYDYLEDYLYGAFYVGSYQHSQIYDWWHPELQGRRGRWLTKGVMGFEPIHHEVSHPKAGNWPWMPCFPVPDTGKAYTRSGMSKMVERAAHEWTGKRTTPHLMRRIWGTWAFQVGLDDKIIHSLAYAMGTSYDTLRKWYEAATPEDKRRAIEEHIDEFFLDYLEQMNTDEENNSSALRKVLQLVPQLSAEERETVRSLLEAG